MNTFRLSGKSDYYLSIAHEQGLYALVKRCLIDSMIQKGAETVFGYDDTVSMRYEILMRTFLFYEMTTYPIEDAFYLSKNLVGSKDDNGATLLMFNNAEQYCNIQGSICEGNILSLSPLSDVKVSVYNDNQLLQMTYSDKNGQYTLKDLPYIEDKYSDYKLKFEKVGYKEKVISLKINSSNLNLETVVLDKNDGSGMLNKVYFHAPTNWDTPNYYAWGIDGALAKWPGYAMIKESGKKDIYSCTVSDKYQNIIFNNGKNGFEIQTDDLTIPGNNYIYDYNKKQWLKYNPDDYENADQNDDELITVYFHQPNEWTGIPTAYVWKDTVSSEEDADIKTAWPGESMTNYAGNCFSYTYPKKYENIIFRSSNGQQTVDSKTPYLDNQCFVLNGDLGSSKFSAMYGLGFSGNWYYQSVVKDYSIKSTDKNVDIYFFNSVKWKNPCAYLDNKYTDHLTSIGNKMIFVGTYFDDTEIYKITVDTDLYSYITINNGLPGKENYRIGAQKIDNNSDNSMIIPDTTLLSGNLYWATTIIHFVK